MAESTSTKPEEQYAIVYFKTVDANGDPVAVEMRLHLIDAREAIERAPHQWARSIDGFAKDAPKIANDMMASVVGASGGKASLGGQIGPVAVHALPKAEAVKVEKAKAAA